MKTTSFINHNVTSFMSIQISSKKHTALQVDRKEEKRIYLLGVGIANSTTAVQQWPVTILL